MTTVARRYFYYINERGNLFHVFDLKGMLDGTCMPSGPTYLRESVFLDFFCSRLRHNSPEHFLPTPAHFTAKEPMQLDDGTIILPSEFLRHFPYVSLCGREKNFLKVQDAPVVFTDYNFDKNAGVLIFGGTLVEPFKPHELTVTREGKLFHPVTVLPKLQNPPIKGLVGAQVGLKLGFDFVCDELNSDGQYVIAWDGRLYPIPFADE